MHRLFIIAICLLFGCRDPQPAVMEDGRIPVRVSLLLISTKQVEFYAWAEKTFEAQNPDIDIIIEQFPGSSLKDYEIKLRLRFSSGQGPDVFHSNENAAAEFAHLGLLSKAPPYIEKMVQENSLNELVREAAYFDGVPYGIVSDIAPTVLFYNRQMFRDAGLDPDRPPANWDELVDFADRLTVRNEEGTIERAGISLRKTGYKPGTAEKWLTFLYSAGGRPFNERGTEARFNSPEGRAALELYKTILFDKQIDSVYHEGDQQGFGQERVAMFLREVHVIRWLRENYPDLDFGVAPVPGKVRSYSGGGAYMFVVNNDSPNPDAAWRFVQFLLSDEGYTAYTGIGGIIPTTKSIAALPQYSENPMMQTFIHQEMAPVRPFFRMSRALEVIGAYIERFCYGRLSAEETLIRAERDVNALLAPNKRFSKP